MMPTRLLRPQVSQTAAATADTGAAASTTVGHAEEMEVEATRPTIRDEFDMENQEEQTMEHAETETEVETVAPETPHGAVDGHGDVPTAVLTDRQRSKRPLVDEGENEGWATETVPGQHLRLEAQADDSDDGEPNYRSAFLSDEDDDDLGEVQQDAVAKPMETGCDEQHEPIPIRSSGDEFGWPDVADSNGDSGRCLSESKRADKLRQGVMRVGLQHERGRQKRRLEDFLAEYDSMLAEPPTSLGENRGGGGDETARTSDRGNNHGEGDHNSPAGDEKKSRRAKRPNTNQRRGASKAAAKRRTGA